MGVLKCIARLDFEIVIGLFSYASNEQISDSVRNTRIQIMICLIYVMVKYDVYKFVLGKCFNLQNKYAQMFYFSKVRHEVKSWGTSAVL